MKLFNICIVVGSMYLAACAYSGGGSSTATPSVAVAPQNSTPTDQRIAFASWTDTYAPNVSGTSSEVTVTYDMTDFTMTGLPAATEKYYIEDYGFFRTTINGTSDRTGHADEGTTQTLSLIHI